MKYTNNACFSGNSPENRLFVARIRDCIELSEKHHSPKFTFFLDERQVFNAREILTDLGCENYLLHGGCDGAKRQVLGVFPQYTDPDASYFPIVSILFSYRKQNILQHKDFLGALMSRQINRDSLGDILILGEGSTVVFAYDTVAEMILSDVDKIGSVGVKVSVYEGENLTVQENFIDIDAVVSSERLDCFVAAVTGLSREKTSDFIKSNGIDVNYTKIYSASHTLAVGDTITVRGYGKYIFDGIDGQTRKDRLRIRIKKYN